MSANILAVVGSKGGVGKSTVAFYTALALAQRGKKTVIVDLDLGFRCQSVFFGVESDIVYDLSDLLANDVFDLDRALKPCSFQDRVYLVPSSSDPFAKLNFERLSIVCAALCARFDTVILDAPPSVSRGFIAAVSLADSAVVVTTPDHIGVKSAALCAQVLTKAGIPQQRLIINMVPVKGGPSPVISDFDAIVDEVGVRLLGVIPYYDGLNSFLQSAKPVPLKTNFIHAFDNISRRLGGEDVRLLIG